MGQDVHRIMKSHLILSIPVLAILALGGCSPEAPKAEPAKKAEAEKPAEPVGAQKAFYAVFPQARIWAPDIEVLTMRDIHPEGVAPGEPGTAGAWQVTFVSPSKGRMRQFTYSVVKAENLDKGASMGMEGSYTARGQEQTFRTAAFKVDSVAAYTTAAAKAGDYIKKNPNKPVTFLLESTKQFPNPAWRVIWGESVATSNLSVYVDASTGEYLKTMH